MKRSLFFLASILLGVFTSQAQSGCTDVNTAANNMEVLKGTSTNLVKDDVLIQRNAVTVNGTFYDAIFTITAKKLNGTGAIKLVTPNPGSVNFQLSNVGPIKNPYITYNLKFVVSGSATTANPGGTPVSLSNIKMYLPDIDGVANLYTGVTNPNKMYVDIAGYKLPAGTTAVVTPGSSNLIQQDFYNNTVNAAPAGFIKYRPNVPTRDYSDNNLTNLAASSLYGIGYSLNFDFATFPTAGIDFLFGVTSDPDQSSVTPDNASRSFYHVFTVKNCLTALPVTFDFIRAVEKNNELKISWRTLSETNNDRFIVEISKDGKKFTTLTEIKSKATDGISNTALEYNYTTSWGAVSFAVAFPAFLVLGLFSYNKKRKIISFIITALMVILLYSCSKNESVVVSQENKKAFVRIGQVDKDGSIQYSKTVQVITE